MNTLTKYVCMALLCAFLLIPFASAALTASDVALSIEDAVERSNPIPEGADDELDDQSELAYVTFSIPVAATGQSETITAVTPNLAGFSYDPFSDEVDSDDRYIVETPLPLTVAAGQTREVVVRVLVPSNLDAVDSSFNRVRHSLSATLTTSDGTKTPALSFYAENNLRLDDVTVQQGSDSFDCSVDDDDRSLDCDDEADEMDRSDFTVEFTIENRFDSDSDLDFENIDFSIDSDNNDIDFDDDLDSEDIDADDELTSSLDFEVDSSIDDGDDATIEIEASVEDENGARHGFRHEFDIQFDTAEYELALPVLSLAPNAVCPGENTVLTYTLQNLGSKRQPNVRPVVINDNLGINKVLATVDLKDSDSSGDTHRSTTTLTVPSSARAGSYPIQMQVYYKDEDSSDALQTQSVTLTVQRCENGVPVNTNTANTGSNGSNGTQNNGVVVVQPGQTGTQTGGQTTAPTTSTNVPVRAVVSESSDTAFVVGLGVAVLVLLIVLGLLIAAIVRK